jgi:hypothetical protein
MCRSTDPRTAHRLSGDLGELEGADMAAMLPVVDEHEEFLGDAEGVGAAGAAPASRKRQRLVSLRVQCSVLTEHGALGGSRGRGGLGGGLPLLLWWNSVCLPPAFVGKTQQWH